MGEILSTEWGLLYQYIIMEGLLYHGGAALGLLYHGIMEGLLYHDYHGGAALGCSGRREARSQGGGRGVDSGDSGRRLRCGLWGCSGADSSEFVQPGRDRILALVCRRVPIWLRGRLWRS